MSRDDLKRVGAEYLSRRAPDSVGPLFGLIAEVLVDEERADELVDETVGQLHLGNLTALHLVADQKRHHKS